MVGLEPADARILVAKSPLHSNELWMGGTPGPSTANLGRLDWRHVSRPICPLDDDFEPEIRSVLRRGG